MPGLPVRHPDSEPGQETRIWAHRGAKARGLPEGTKCREVRIPTVERPQGDAHPKGASGSLE